MNKTWLQAGSLFAVSAMLAVSAAQPPPAVESAAYRPVDPAEARLGQLLFYDPILSGNENIACATCHHPRFGTSDGVSLSIGDGGVLLGPDRHADPSNPPERRVARNSPGLFNLGAHEFTVLFHDGRIETDPSSPSGVRTPLSDEMPAGFSDLLSAQTMFPVISPDEMAGHYNENDVARAVTTGRITGPDGAWQLLAKRVASIESYVERFAAVYPDIAGGRAISFADVANAIGAFIAYEWRSDTSPFDRHVRGQATLGERELRGLSLFYGEAGCASCHTGPFQTDHGFHAMGVPQFGPGKAARFEAHAKDVGRARVTGKRQDEYRFRTPSLRNVSKTAPYGHSGAYRSLRDFVVAHLQPATAISRYRRKQALLPSLPVDDWAVLDDAEASGAIAAAADERRLVLAKEDLDALLAFLHTLTDTQALSGRLGIPQRVPSGLPVDR